MRNVVQWAVISAALTSALSWPMLDSTAHAATAADQPAPKAPDAGQGEDAEAEAVVLRAIAAALKGDFARYLEDVDPDRCASPEQKSQLQRYEFKRFSAQAGWYVSDPKKPAVTVVRRDRTGDRKIKLFLKDLVHSGSMPRPVELTRGPGDRWYITSNSL